MHISFETTSQIYKIPEKSKANMEDEATNNENELLLNEIKILNLFDEVLTHCKKVVQFLADPKEHTCHCGATRVFFDKEMQKWCQTLENYEERFEQLKYENFRWKDNFRKEDENKVVQESIIETGDHNYTTIVGQCKQVEKIKISTTKIEKEFINEGNENIDASEENLSNKRSSDEDDFQLLTEIKKLKQSQPNANQFLLIPINSPQVQLLPVANVVNNNSNDSRSIVRQPQTTIPPMLLNSSLKSRLSQKKKKLNSKSTFKTVLKTPKLENEFEKPQEKNTNVGVEETSEVPSEENQNQNVVRKYNIKCDREDCTFSTCFQRFMVKHQFEVHNQTYCTFAGCNYTAKDPDALVRHERYHLNKRHLQCNHCPYKTFDQGFLDEHMQTHPNAINGAFKCDWENCKYEAVSQYRLDQHKLIHTS